MKKVVFLLVFATASIIAQVDRNITIDFTNEIGKLDKTFLKCIGAGRANEGLRADWQQQLRLVKKECGFEYIRFHGLLHDDMGVYTEDKKGNSIYNWQYIDKLYDFILEIGMKPFVELSFMPSALASGEQTVFWWKANVSPPKSYKIYAELIEKLTKHLTERYGKEEVKSWYFEVWNEPNHHAFFSGKKEDYFKIYKTAVTAIKSVSKDYKVGGPASSGVGWIQDILNYCSENEVPIDFIATHYYGVSGAGLDEFGEKLHRMSKREDEVFRGVKYARNKIDETSFRDLELHFTEWSTSYSPKDNVHDNYLNATYVLNTLKKSHGLHSSMSYWVFTDIFEEAGVPTTPFHGGFGLLNLQSIKKPTYFIYKYLNQLGDIELENKDQSSWVSKTEDGIQILAWDFSFKHPGEKSNQEFYTKDIPSLDKGEFAIHIENLPKGKYILKVFKTGYKYNDAFSGYLDMGRPNQLTKNQVDFLKDATNDKPVVEEKIKVKKNGIVDLKLPLKENDIYLVKYTKIKR